MLLPTEKNQYRPAFLKPENLFKVVAGLMILELAVFMAPFLYYNGSQFFSNLASVLPSVLNDLTNQERSQNNLSLLKVSPLLEQAATYKAQDMANGQYFSHTSPDGKEPWYWFEKVGYAYTFAGENLAIDFSDSKRITKAWMNSPTHRSNIIKEQYSEVGTGVALGRYEGRDTIYVVQLYANPAVVSANLVVDGQVAGAATVANLTDADLGQFGEVSEEELRLALADLTKIAEEKLSFNNQAVLAVASNETTNIPDTTAVDYGPSDNSELGNENNSTPTTDYSQPQNSESNSLVNAFIPTGNFTSSIAYIVMNIILVTMAILVLLAILLKIIAIKRGKLVGHYFDIILNALFLVILVLVIYFLNSWLVKNSREESLQSSIDFANTQQVG